MIHCYNMRKFSSTEFSEKIRVGHLKLVSDIITESDQAVRAVHSWNSWFVSCLVQSCLSNICPIGLMLHVPYIRKKIMSMSIRR